MLPLLRAGALILLSSLCGLAEAQGTAAVGTAVHVRLRQTVSSFGSKRDMPVSAMVIQPVRVGDAVVLPLRTELRGEIAVVRRIGLGFSTERAKIQIHWYSMRVPGGRWTPVELRTAEVDNSRETVDKDGTIHGIRATASASKALSGLAISAASFDPMATMFGLSASMSAFRIPESEIIMPTGTELTLELMKPITTTEDVAAIPSLGAEEATQIQAMAKKLPYRTTTEAKKEPSDITSIMFLGDQETVIRALEAADWSRSDVLSAKSTYGTMRSVVENQGYREGPVSTLVLGGQRPVGAWSKTLDTFFARHHLRLFAQPVKYDGMPVLLTSATHDSGIGINKSTKSLIHIIDENIDEERDKIVYDMLLTGCVDGVEYIDRPWIPADLRNATGDTLRTDRKMAVIKMNACTQPVRADVPEPEFKDIRTKANAPSRVLRNGALYLRDDIYRGNIIYQGYSVGKLGFRALRKKHEPKDTEQPQTLNAMGQTYQVVDRPKEKMPPWEEEPQEAASLHPSFHLPGEPKSYEARLDYSISFGYARYANRTFSTQQLNTTDSSETPPFVFSMDAIQSLRSGLSIQVRATVHSWKYVSNEFAYAYNFADLRTHIATGVPEADGDIEADGTVRQFSYNALIYAKPNGARFRPYVAVGPVLQFLRLDDAKADKNKLLSYAFKDAGLFLDAYNFGSRPPFEGGGIFQFGLQYGAGYRYALTPHMFVRGDFRETISPQPDYWTKSYPSLAELSDDPDFTFSAGRQTFGGLLRQRTFTMGFGVSF